jgi:hypothetical protein
MKINLEEAANTGVLPEGEYLARIADAKESTSKAGNDMLVLDFVVENGTWKGAEVRDWVVPGNPMGAGRLKVIMQAAGLPTPDGSFELRVEDLVDKRLEVSVRHEAYEGSMKPKIKAYAKPVGSDIPTPLDPISNGTAAPAEDSNLPF